MSKKNVEWEWKKLGDVCDFNRGLTYAKKDEVEFSSNCILRSNNVDLETNALNLDELKYIRKDFDIPTSKYVKQGCLLICMSNGSKSHLGKVAYIDQDYNFAFGGFMGLLCPNNSVNGKFLHLMMCTPAYKEYIKSLSDGANINNLKYDDLKEFDIPIPPLDEQERIVKVLDDAFKKIDTIKTTAETNLQNAKELFQTTLANELSITDEKIKQGWEEKTLDDCCEITSILVDPKETKYRKLLHVGGANIESETGRLLDLQTAEEENLISGKFLFDDTMILYSKIRPYLKKIVQPDFSGLCSADIYPLNVKRNMNKGFLFYTLFSEPFTDFANKNSARAGMPKINRESLFAYKFFLPPLPIQKQIVAKLDSLSEKVKQLESNYKQVLADCDELKKSILKKAFNGEI